MAETERFDAIIVGSGQAGGPLSTALVRAGRRTALVEREHIGGTCINEGCTPTKTMVASARSAYVAERGPEYGITRSGPIAVDMKVVRQRKRDMVDRFRGHSRDSILAGGVDIVTGAARFTGSQVVAVALNDGGERVLTAPLVVIDAGCRPRIPPIEGIGSVPVLTSTTIMELDAVPEHLIILGGGYIGAEFAQMFRRFGSKVTVIEAAPALLGREDADIAAAMAEIFRQDGIDVLVGATVSRVAQAGSDVSVIVSVDGRDRTVTGSHLLVATGRQPNTEDLNLPAAGVEVDNHGFIRVDERLRTTTDDVYATGDIVGGPAFTHISYDDFRILRSNLLEGGNRTTTDRLVPYTVFTDPQLGRVGRNETQARQEGIEYRVARLGMDSIARAIELGETRGFMKALVDPATEQILGCAVLGIEGGELMAMIEIAMMGKVPYSTLRDGIFAHPTLAECFSGLFESVTA